MLTMKYHAAILDLVGAMASPSSQRLAAFKGREKACGVHFPASVREWFVLNDADSLFEEFTSPDFLVPIGELGNPSETAQGYLRIARENQNVVAWYVRLDQGDDPAVYDNNDQWPDDLTTVKWNLCSASFSGFMFNNMASWRFGGLMPGWYLEAKEPLPDPATRKVLAQRFRQGPMTENATANVFRYYDPHGVITIGGSQQGGPFADWRIQAESEEWLYDFAKRVWDLGSLSKTLKAEVGNPNAIGPRVLQRLRDERGRTSG
jgi:hypothetical protein